MDEAFAVCNAPKKKKEKKKGRKRETEEPHTVFVRSLHFCPFEMEDISTGNSVKIKSHLYVGKLSFKI